MAHITLATDIDGLVLAVFDKPGGGGKETKPEMIEAHAISFGRSTADAQATNLQVHFTMSDVANLPVFMKAMHQGTGLSLGVTVYDSPTFDRQILYVSSSAAQIEEVHLQASDTDPHPSFTMTVTFVDVTLTRFVLDHTGDNDEKQQFSYQPSAL